MVRRVNENLYIYNLFEGERLEFPGQGEVNPE
jgi:hypothetical protein